MFLETSPCSTIIPDFFFQKKLAPVAALQRPVPRRVQFSLEDLWAHLRTFPAWAGTKSAFSCLCFPDTNVIRYIQLTEMKIRRNAQRDKKEAT